MSQLIVDHIKKDYQTSCGPVHALRPCSFSLTSPESLAIVGPSGSGKSTLLSILGTLEPPTQGTVLLDGINLVSLSASETISFRRQNLGVIFQDHFLLPQCSALENILIPILAERRIIREDQEKAKSLLERVGLKDRFHHRPGELSGGECQRVSIARAIFRHPKLLLADEPTGSLDRTNADSIAQLLFDLIQSEEMICVLATHDLSIAKQANKIFPLNFSEEEK